MPNTLRIAILDINNGVENEGMRCIKKIVENFGKTYGIQTEYEVFDVRKRLEFPGLSFDGYISSGGPGSPQPVGAPWERKFFKFLDSIWIYNANRKNQIKKPLFLICHSFQMACVHWQIGYVGKRRSVSFGTFPIHKTRLGRMEAFLEGLPDPFWAVDSRDYQVIRPNRAVLERMNAVIICLEKIRPHVRLERAIMAVRFSDSIFGTQFHPEADAEGMMRYFNKPEKRANVIKAHGLAKYESMIDHLSDPDKISLTEATILPNFLESVMKQKEKVLATIEAS